MGVSSAAGFVRDARDRDRPRRRTAGRGPAALLRAAAALAAGALPSLFPAIALASAGREGHAGGARCQVQIGALAGELTAGETATLAGSLTCASEEAGAEQAVSIYRHEAGTRGFALVGTSTTEANG